MALEANPDQLEMSDLKPLFASGEDDGLDAQLSEAPPYPFAQIAPDTPIALYFELYHLGFDSDERTRYTVEYDVERRTEQGFWASLFRGEDVRRTTTRTTYEGSSSTEQEYILLDLSAFEDPTGDLMVTIRVTDENTGRTVSRSIDFRVTPELDRSAE